MKHCVFFKKAKGRKKYQIRCGFDGSLRNACHKYACPHFKPTLRHVIWRWIGRD